MLSILKNARMPLFLHRKSNHIFTVWQHLVLLTIRQYEGKSYRMFTEWLLVEVYYLRMFLNLSRIIPHFTTLQKFTDRITGTILESIISSFILLTTIKQIFFGIDSSGFKPSHAPQYYTERSRLRKKWIIKLSVGDDDMLKQIICTIKIRRAPKRHDNIDFQPIITRTSEIRPLSIAVYVTRAMTVKRIMY